MALNTTVTIPTTKAALTSEPGSALRSVPRGALSLMPVLGCRSAIRRLPQSHCEEASHPGCPCGPTIGGKATTNPGQDERLPDPPQRAPNDRGSDSALAVTKVRRRL